MTDSVDSSKYEDKRIKTNKRKSKNKIGIKILLFIVSMGIWGGVVYYGYISAKDYIDTSLNNVQQNNVMLVQQLEEEVKIVSSEIKRLQNEVKDLKKEVRDTDSTLSNTSDIQEEIDKKLKYLDDKLVELKESLKVLEEAPNVKN